MTENEEGLRVDRWLWFTRFYKSRSQATAAASGGHVRINGERARPGTRVRPGDTVQLVRHQLEYRVEILELPARRGPAAEARATYREDPESVARREAASDSLRHDRMHMPRTDGRPDKRTRRLLRDRNRGS